MELLTVQETAQRLKVAPITIRRYIASGRLPAVRIGRQVRVRKEAIEGFIEPIENDRRDRRRAESVDGPETLTRALLRLVEIAGANDGEDGSTDISADKYKHLTDVYTPRP